jgi:hypothetical protein
MGSRANILSRAVFLLLLAAASLVLAGCASPSANLSERPWDSPQGWENGIGGMMGPGGLYGR